MYLRTQEVSPYLDLCMEVLDRYLVLDSASTNECCQEMLGTFGTQVPCRDDERQG